MSDHLSSQSWTCPASSGRDGRRGRPFRVTHPPSCWTHTSPWKQKGGRMGWRRISCISDITTRIAARSPQGWKYPDSGNSWIHLPDPQPDQGLIWATSIQLAVISLKEKWNNGLISLTECTALDFRLLWTVVPCTGVESECGVRMWSRGVECLKADSNGRSLASAPLSAGFMSH